MMLKYCFDRYNIKEMYDEPVDNFLPALKFALDWFLASKQQYAIFDEDFGNATTSSDEMVMLSVEINNSNLDDIYFMNKILNLLFMSNFWLGVIDINKAKTFKITIRINVCNIASIKMMDRYMREEEKKE